MSCTACHPVYGTTATLPSDLVGLRNAAEPAADPVDPAAPNDFKTLVKLYRDYDRDLLSLRSLDRQRESARVYLQSADCNPALANAVSEKLRRKRESVLAGLRVNRVQARELLSRLENGTA